MNKEWRSLTEEVDDLRKEIIIALHRLQLLGNKLGRQEVLTEEQMKYGEVKIEE